MISNASFSQDTPTQLLSHSNPSVVGPAVVTNRTPGYRKSRNYRKRYIPAGPAGVWFQTQQQQKIQNHMDENRRNQNASMTTQENVEEDEILGTQRLKSDKQQPNKVRSDESSSFYSPAWTAAQCHLGFSTPNCSPWLSPSQRYSMIRPFVPSDFVLIRDITSMQNIWKLPNNRKMLVMVHNIQALLGDHYLWTATLTDETGSFIQAWLQPSLVQKEQQQPTPQYLKLGVVWMLSDVTLQLMFNDSGCNNKYRPLLENDEDDDDENDDTDDIENINSDRYRVQSNHHERMMLIAESNIEQVWTAASEKEISNEVYIQWMEKKNSATVSVMESFEKRSVGGKEGGNNSSDACSIKMAYEIDDTASVNSSSTEEAEFIDISNTTEIHALQSRKRPICTDTSDEENEVSSKQNSLMHLNFRTTDMNFPNSLAETPKKTDPTSFFPLQTEKPTLAPVNLQKSFHGQLSPTFRIPQNMNQKSDYLSDGTILATTNPYSKSSKSTERQQPRTGECPNIDSDHTPRDSHSNITIREQINIDGANEENAIQKESASNVLVPSENDFVIEGKENNSIMSKKSRILTEVNASSTGTNEQTRSTATCQSDTTLTHSYKYTKPSEGRQPVVTNSKLWSKEAGITDFFIDDDEDLQDESDKVDSCIIDSSAHLGHQQNTRNAKDPSPSRESFRAIEPLDKRPQSNSSSNESAMKESMSSRQTAKTSLFQKSAFGGLLLDEFFSDDDTFS